MHHHFRRLAPVFAFGLPLAALAQSAGIEPARTDATSTPLQYRSAFADYEPYKDVPLANWRAVNDAVAGSAGGAGGHAGHSMSEMSDGMGQAPMADVPPKRSSTKPVHEHHQMHGGRK